MNQKALKKKNKKPAKSGRARLPVVEEEVIEEELTFGDKVLAAVTPYLGTILFAIVAGFLAFALVAFLLRSSADSKAFEWRELSSASSIARQTGDISGWTRVAQEYPDSKAGSWASQFAGDFQLREGLAALATDQKAGFGMINKSKTYFQSVIDAAPSAKTPTLQQRSHFSLAYAHESLGEFSESKALYEKLIEEAPDSAFAGHARRGVNRSSSSDYSGLYAKFTNWQEEEIGDAPGPRLPDRPSIDFDDVELPPGEKPPTTSGVTPPVSGGASAAAVATEAPKAAVTPPVSAGTSEKMDKTAEMKAAEMKATEMKAVEVKPAAMKPASEVLKAVDQTAQPVEPAAPKVLGEAAPVVPTAEPVVGAAKEAAGSLKKAVKEVVVPPTK